MACAVAWFDGGRMVHRVRPRTRVSGGVVAVGPPSFGLLGRLCAPREPSMLAATRGIRVLAALVGLLVAPAGAGADADLPSGTPSPFSPFTSAAVGAGLSPGEVGAPADVRRMLASGAVRFDANAGQWDRRVLFAARGSASSLLLTRTGAVLNVHGGALRLRFVGGASRPAVTGQQRRAGVSNYLIGNHRSRWRSNVPSYGRVRSRAVWPGIDVVFHGDQRRLEYDFEVAPGADPRRIAVAFSGYSAMRVDRRGELLLTVGGRLVRQPRPVAYQEVGGARRRVDVRYALAGNGRVGLRLGVYDRARGLVIDPLLSYSSYLGGSDGDAATAVAVDASGKIYITGSTLSLDFPTVAPLQGTHAPGSFSVGNDAFIAKLDPVSNTLVYSTYLGGSASDAGRGIALGTGGRVFVAGSTYSVDFPTAAPAQPRHGGTGDSDAFVTELSPTGASLVYSTYLGGASGEIVGGVAVDSSDHAYVVGSTYSGNFPTVNPVQGTFKGNPADAFVTKFAPDGNRVYSTFLGGSSPDFGQAIAVDGDDRVVVGGETGSTDFPIRNALEPSRGPYSTAFLTKLDASGATLDFSTYFGGNSGAELHGLVLDGAGAIFATGRASGVGFPVVAALQPTAGGFGDAIVAKVSGDGQTVAYATYLGGSGDDSGDGIAIDGTGAAYVIGSSSSTNFPARSALRPFSGRQTYVAKLTPDGSGLAFSTPVLSLWASGVAIAKVANGDAWFVGSFAGSTPLTDLPTVRPFQATFGGSSDAFVAALDVSDDTPPDTELTGAPADPSSANAATFTFISTEPGAGSHFECRLDDAAFSACDAPQTYHALTDDSHVFRVRAIDAYSNVDPSPAAYTWTVDSMPPETSMEQHPPGVTNATSATLAFSSSAADSTFECRLDGAVFALCSTPVSYAGLSDGGHRFEVRATDPAGNTDASPASWSWTIDRTPPDTVIDGGPVSPSTVTSPSFVFSATEAGSTFECRLDAAVYEGCSSPRSYTGLEDGPHAFRVRATDPAGNTDPSEASHTWTIETSAPETSLISGPPPLTGSSTATFVFEANEPSTFACRLDAQAFSSCSSPASYAGLGEGDHTFAVRAMDLSSKVDPSPASHAWSVDLTPPAAVSPGQPAAGSVNLPASPVFSWAPTTDGRTGVDRYELWVDGALRRTVSPLLCGPGCSATLDVALDDGPHGWQVRAADGVGNVSASETRSFTVDAAPPQPFALQAPADDAVLATRRPQLSWQASVDTGIGLAGYDVLVDDHAAAGGLGPGATTFTPVGDLAEGVHRWSVVARDGYGNARPSAARRFTVDVTPPTAAFTAAPNPVLAGRSVTFGAAGSSDAISGIVRYEWDLDGDGSFERDTGATPSTSASYPEAGTFAVQLRVTDRASLTDVTRIDQRVSRDPRAASQPGVSINGGAAYTNRATVTIKARWPSFATQMLISNDGGFDHPTTAALQAKTPWALETDGAERTSRIVYVRFVRGLTISEDYTDDIVLDERAPTVTSARVVPRKGTAPVLALRARDRGLSGVARVQVTNNRRDPNAKLRASRAMVKLDRRRGERRLSLRKAIYVRVRDRAGNFSAWRLARVARGAGRA